MKFICEKCGYVNIIDTPRNKSQRRIMKEKRAVDPDYGQPDRKVKRQKKTSTIEKSSEFIKTNEQSDIKENIK